MKVLGRVRRLEDGQRRAGLDPAHMESRRQHENLSLLLRTDPHPAGEYAILLNEAHRRAADGKFLTREQVEEGVRLAAHVTASLRRARLAAGLEPDETVYTFPYEPAPGCMNDSAKIAV